MVKKTKVIKGRRALAKSADSKATASWFSLSAVVVGLGAVGLGCFYYFAYGNQESFSPRDVPNRTLDHIDRRSNLSLEEFIRLYDTKWPVLITDAMTDWPAKAKWNWQYFLQRYGGEKVAMKGVHGKLEDGQMLSVTLGTFHEHKHESTFSTWTYISDELFIPTRPELAKDIGTPVYMKENFFKLLPKDLQPWDNMLLWGTKHSRSALHIDPYNWTGTNAVLQGVKRWKLYPPGQDHLLYVRRNKYCGFPLDCFKYNSEVDAFDPDLKRFPLFAQAKALEFDQKPGEMLMIPSGWFHQAYNPEECLAVSSQFFNSQNARLVMEEIFKVGDIKKNHLASGYTSQAPKDQVQAMVKAIPKHVITKGKEVTQTVLDQFRSKTAG